MPIDRFARQGFQPSRGGIVIGDDVWIGANCVLLDGARIGTGSVLGAASLLRGILPPFCLRLACPRWCEAGAAGNAKFTRAKRKTGAGKALWDL